MRRMPVVKALSQGYHVLCEKPMSPNEEEMIAMGQMAEKTGKIGRLLNIQHIEEVGYWHHAHSFVRGNWRNAEESSPMILAKCCHDMDILLWLTGSHCKEISSFGELTYFKKENAPEDAPMYCMDECVHRDTCPFYAPKFYLEHKRAMFDNLIRAVSLDIGKEAVLEKLKTGPYGRCVFHCDNTVGKGEDSICKGSPVINIHIPQGEKLDREACQKSLEWARHTYGTKYPYVCHSWLLYPGLQNVLRETSNILRFQQRFKIIEVDYKEREAEWRVFGTVKNVITEYPEGTSLQRGVKEYLLEGNILGNGWGILRGI